MFPPSLLLYLVVLCIYLVLSDGFQLYRIRLPAVRTRMLMNMENKEGSDSGTTLPFNKVISPPYGAKKSGVQKFMMMYTCNMCNHRNAHMVRGNRLSSLHP